MSTEIRYVVDPRLRLEVANRISLDFLSEQDRKLMANIIRVGEFSIKTQPEKRLSEVKYKDSNKKSMKKKCFKTLELHEEMDEELMDCRDIFKPGSTSLAFDKVVELTKKKIDFVGQKCVNSICTNFTTIPEDELAVIAAKVLSEMETPEQVYEFFSLFVYRDNHKLMERFPNFFVHRETLYAFIKKFAPMKIKDLSENSDYAKMVAVLQEWLEDQTNVSQLGVLWDMLENYENLVNMGIQGLRVFNERRQFFLNHHKRRVEALQVEHNAKIQFQEKRLRARQLRLEDELAKQEKGDEEIKRLQARLASIQEELNEAQSAKQIDQEKIKALEDDKKKIISDSEKKLHELEKRKKEVHIVLDQTAMELNTARKAKQIDREKIKALEDEKETIISKSKRELHELDEKNRTAHYMWTKDWKEKQQLQQELTEVRNENESFKSDLAQLSITDEARQKLVAQLQMEKTELQSLREILEKEKTLLQTQVKTTQNNYNESVLRIENLTARNQNLENEKKRLELEVSAASTANKSYEQKIIQLKIQIASIDEKLKLAYEEKETFQKLQGENAEMLIDAQKKLEEEKKKLKLSNQQNDDNLETIKKQVQTYDAEITKLQEEKQVLQNQKTETETKLEEAQKEIKTKQSEIILFEEKLKQTEKENEDEKNKIVDFVEYLQSQIATLRKQKSEEMKTLNSAIEQLQAEKNDLEKRIEAQKTEKKEYLKTIGEKYGKVKTQYLTENKKLQEKIELQQQSLCDLNIRFQALQKTKTDLNKEKEQLTDAAAKLQEQNQDYKKNLEQANEVVRTLETMTSDHESVIDRLYQDIVQLQRKISDSDSGDEDDETHNTDEDDETHTTQLSKRHGPFLSMISQFFEMKTKQSDDRNGIQRENYPMSDYDEEEIKARKQKILDHYFEDCKLNAGKKSEIIKNCKRNPQFRLFEEIINLKLKEWADDKIQNFLEFLCEAVEDENFGNAIVTRQPNDAQHKLVGYQFGKTGSTPLYWLNKTPVQFIRGDFTNNPDAKEFTVDLALEDRQVPNATPSSSFQPASFDVDSFTTPNATNIASSKMFAQPPYYYPPVYHPPASPWPLQFHMPQPQPTKHAGQVCYVVMPKVLSRHEMTVFT